MRDGETPCWGRTRRRGGAARGARGARGAAHRARCLTRDPILVQLCWGTRYEAPHSVLSTLASRNSHCTLSTVEQRHASCGQTCESTVVLAGRGGGAGTQLRGRTLGHVARAWRLASLACLARVCRRAVRRARRRPPGRGHSGKNHSDRPGAQSAGRVRAGRRTRARECYFSLAGMRGAAGSRLFAVRRSAILVS